MVLGGVIWFKVCDVEFYTIFKRFHHMKMHGCIEQGMEQKVEFLYWKNHFSRFNTM